MLKETWDLYADSLQEAPRGDYVVPRPVSTQVFSLSRWTSSDVSEVVEIHQQSFPGFFLTSLGPAFLREMYSGFVDSPSQVGYVARDHTGTALGFAVGVCDQTRFYARLVRRRWHRFALASLSALLRHPGIAFRLVRALGYPRAARKASAPAALMSIAVRPVAQRQGIGRQILDAFLSDMKRQGVQAVMLTTDALENDGANRFYERAGFCLARVFVTSEGRTMNEYVIDLANWKPMD